MGSLPCEDRGPTRGSLEPIGPRGSPLKWESVSRKGSGTNLGDMPGTPSSSETSFESDLCVWNLSFELTRDVLEHGARACSTLGARPFGDTGPNEGTLRQMVLSLIE